MALVSRMTYAGIVASGLWDMNGGLSIDAERGLIAGGRTNAGVRVVDFTTGQVLHEYTTETDPALAHGSVSGVELRWPFLAVFHPSGLTYAMTVVNIVSGTSEAINDGRNAGVRHGKWSASGGRIYYASFQARGARCVSFPFTGVSIYYDSLPNYYYVDVAYDSRGTEWVTYTRDAGSGSAGSVDVSILRAPRLENEGYMSRTIIRTDNSDVHGIPASSLGYRIRRASFDPDRHRVAGYVPGPNGFWCLWDVREGVGPVRRIAIPAEGVLGDVIPDTIQSFVFVHPSYIIAPTNTERFFSLDLLTGKLEFDVQAITSDPNGFFHSFCRSDGYGGRILYGIATSGMNGLVYVVDVMETIAGRMILGARQDDLLGPESRSNGTRSRTFFL